MKEQRPTQRIGYFPEQHAPVPTPAVRRPQVQPQKKRKPAINPIRLLMLVVCVCVFCTCFFLLARYAWHILISRSASHQMEEAYLAAQQAVSEPSDAPEETPIPTQAPASAPVQTASARPAATVQPKLRADQLWPTTYRDNPTRRVSSVFYQLQQQNPDIVGWLKIDGVVEEPVLQRDNEYYLTHNSLKQKSVTGALFLDENCDLDTVPTQMLIHGHNMKEGAMFGSLMKYKVRDASFYRAHPFIEFNTIYENGRYVIFAVCEVDIRSTKPDFLGFWHNDRFASVEAFMDYVQRAQMLSQIRCNVDVQPGDRLLTLSTCTVSDDNKRLIVMARKLRDGEDELQLNISIFSTSDR